MLLSSNEFFTLVQKLATPPAPVPAPSAQNGVFTSQLATPCGPSCPARADRLPALVQDASVKTHSRYTCAASTPPRTEQVYSPEKYFSEEPYINVEIENLELENFTVIDQGQIDSLDLVYLLQTKIGQKDAVNAAIGLGGGSWVDYVNESNDLFMTVKISGDDVNELNEISDAFQNWADFQTRFTKSLSNSSWKGILYEGDTNFWIYNDGNYLRLALSNDIEFMLSFLSDCSNEQCNTSF